MIAGLSAILGTLAVLAAILGMVWYASKQANAWRNALQQVAAKHTLSYELGGMFNQPSCSGTIGRHRVVVDSYTVSTGQTSSTYTRIRISNGVAPSLTLTSEGMLSTLGKAFLGDDFQVGDPEFDDFVVVRGEGGNRVLSRLDHRTRQVVRAAVTAGASLSKGEWTLRKGGHVTDANQLSAMVRCTLAAAEALERTDGSVQDGLRRLMQDDPAHGVRLGAARALGGPEAIVTFTELLTHPDSTLRLRAAVALAQSDGPHPDDLESTLLAHLVTPDATLFEALARVGTVTAVPPLRELTEGRLKLGATARQANEAIRAIQARIVGAEAGALAVADGSPGQLSEAEAVRDSAQRARAARQRES